MEDCLFCKIANKELPAQIVYDDEEILGFSSIEPEAPIHLLFIPKKHIEWNNNLGEEGLLLLGKIISSAKKVATEKGIFEACKFIFNIGKTGHISHIHLHLLGGWKNEIPMNNI